LSELGFIYPPSPPILQWLCAGQLGNRFQRSIRLWVLLHRFYHPDFLWSDSLPQPFTYPDVRARLFSVSHPKSDHFSAGELITACHDPTCVCHKTLKDWVFTSETHQEEPVWCEQVMQMTGLSTEELAKHLQAHPFATVHRTLRDDLKQLTKAGWFKSFHPSSYQLKPDKEWPTPPAPMNPVPNFPQLSLAQTWEFLRVLESVAFVEPNLELVVRSLWEQVTDNVSTVSKLAKEPVQRIFIHLDYILSEEKQDQVDTYQEQLKSLWHQGQGGIIQFNYWVVAEERQIKVTTYPVCLHYVRRAKYLSAYGVDPDGKFGWHNYRLDRIASNRLKILVWGDPNIPKSLKDLWRAGELPTPETVDHKLKEAWGFNFYLPSSLLILRFPRQFAKWYVDQTERHQTFKPIAHHKLPQLIHRHIDDLEDRQQLLQIIQSRPAIDAYYTAQIRLGDINVLMRLRDWRPKGEVIAPLSIRQQLKEEALQELSHYQ
jgi:CRISPR-associated protein (TIGR03985 family)